MSEILLIWGAGGHGKVVLDLARATGSFKNVAFIDDNLSRAGSTFCEHPVLGGPEELGRHSDGQFVVAVGDNRIRSRCFSRALEGGPLPATLVHPSAIIASSASIGRGTVVMPGVIVNAGAVIGENCILNTGAIVEHDCRIGAHVHISPRAVLGGGVNAGPLAHVGIGAVVLPGATIGEESVVGAGAVVLKEVPARCTVAGVPARRL